MRIDAHQHYWKYNSTDYVWMTPEQAQLHRDFLPEHFEPVMRASGFDGSIAVEARQKLEETEWLLRLADEHDFIKGVVGWVDLCGEDVEDELRAVAAHPKLRGIRHVVHDEPDDDFILRPEFIRGISFLSQLGLCYDLLVYPRHLSRVVKLLARFPDQPFVVDHIAKPAIRDCGLAPWDSLIREVAAFPNVMCKLSGMVTEADISHWSMREFIPYLDIVFEAFGPDRLMIGSDWPVCTLAGSYGDIVRIVVDYLDSFDSSVQRGVLGANCLRFYGIEE